MDELPHGYPREHFFCGVLRQMRYKVGCRVLCALDEAMGERKLRIIGSLGDYNAICQYAGNADTEGHVYVLPEGAMGAESAEQLEAIYRKKGRKVFAAESLKKGGPYGSGGPNEGAAQIHHLELCVDATLAVHALHIGLEEGMLSDTIKICAAPWYVSIFHEECHFVRMLCGCTGNRALLMPFSISESYDILEEYLNIFADPEFSERLLLEEMREPIRLGHHGMNFCLSTGNANVDFKLGLYCPFRPRTLQQSLLKARLELGRLTKEAYEEWVAKLK
jgi:hypothetical protein